MANSALVERLIRHAARRYRVDPAAALSVASTEGGIRFGAVGDYGTSFGPFQLHRGGALPAGKSAAWANSKAGINYAVRAMSRAGARGLRGKSAINAIVRRFERPADPDSQVAKAVSRYKQFAGQSPARGSFQPSGFGGGGGVNRQALVQFIMANNASFAQTGRIDTSMQGATLVAALKSMREGSDLGAGSFDAPYALNKAPRSRAKAMVEAMRHARKMGLAVRENPKYDPVDPVHTEGSYHYRRFSPSLGRAADISGDPRKMVAFTRWARRRYGSKAAELFHDPVGGWKHGASIGAIGGHGKHVHIAF